MSEPAPRRNLPPLSASRCAAAAAAAVCALLLTGCGLFDDEPAESSQTHPATTAAAAHPSQAEDTPGAVQRYALLIYRWVFIGVVVCVCGFVVLVGAACIFVFIDARCNTDERARRRSKVQGPIRGCAVAYTSVTGHEFEFGIKELSPGCWIVFVPSHPYSAASWSDKYFEYRLDYSHNKRDNVCWSTRITDPLDAYKIAVLWAESISGLRTTRVFAPPDELHSTDPPPGSEIESLAAPYRSRGGQPYDAEFDHITQTGRRFRFGLRCGDTGWGIYVLAQPDYANRAAGLQATHRSRNARDELLVCWTGRLDSALDAYRVAVLWAEATCGYITTGQFDTTAEPGGVPAPAAGSPLGQLCTQ